MRPSGSHALNAELESLYDKLDARIAQDPLLADLGIAARAKPSVRLFSRDLPLPIGASRIGGTPDVPPGFEWPRWTPEPDPERGETESAELGNGRSVPLGFIAQLDLSELPRADESLPSSGWLYFFYDRYLERWGYAPDDRGCARVIYAACDRSELQRVGAPPDGEAEHSARACGVHARLELTVPDELPGLKYGTPDYDAYYKLANEITKGSSHRLLGHPQPLQGEMELQCQLASNGVSRSSENPWAPPSAEVRALTPGAADWRLLLQVDTDENGPEWMWGDCGRIYYWIRTQDLFARRFDNTWLILQCG